LRDDRYNIKNLLKMSKRNQSRKKVKDEAPRNNQKLVATTEAEQMQLYTSLCSDGLAELNDAINMFRERVQKK